MSETVETITARGFWGDHVKIVKIIRNRHTAMLKECDKYTSESKVTYCNFCGGSFTLNNKCTCCSFDHK